MSDQGLEVDETTSYESDRFRVLERSRKHDKWMKSSSYLVRITVLEADIDFIRTEMHKWEL